MLSTERCREYLGPQCPMTDKEIETLRDQLYALAALVIDATVASRLPSTPKDPST